MTRHFARLDAVRFLSAAVVALYHIGLPLFGPQEGAGTLVQQLWRSATPGTPAVMVFFLLSGFCIHYPFTQGAPWNPRAFYVRRCVRLLLPLVVWLPLAWLLRTWRVSTDVLWSLWAELLFYLAYPAVRRALARWDGGVVYSVALIGAANLVFWGGSREYCFSYGILGSALAGLPVWLLGCRLAEQAPRWSALPAPPRRRLWGWRALVWFSASLSWLLHWKAIPDVILMNLFAPVAYLWLEQEIAAEKAYPAWPWLARAGAWSYSYYLVHSGISTALQRALSLPDSKNDLGAALVVHAIVLVCAYGFYRLVERPAHQLARRCGQAISRA